MEILCARCHIKFEGHYKEWRDKRVDFLIRSMGADYWQGKHGLEMGAGHGHVSRRLEAHGAIMLGTEGRADNRREAMKMGRPPILLFDHEKPFDFGTFDFVVHWGLLYHLESWQVSLISALQAAPLAFVESIIESKSKGKVAEDKNYDQSLSGFGSRFTSQEVEEVFRSQQFTWTRYDSVELDSEYHKYSWAEDEKPKKEVSFRRLWIARRNGNE